MQTINFGIKVEEGVAVEVEGKSTKRFTIVSGDAHIGPRIQDYRPYLDPQYRELLDELDRKESALYSAGMQAGRQNLRDIELVGDRGQTSIETMAPYYFDLKARLGEMDRDGVVAEVTMMGGEGTAQTPFFSEFNYPYPPDVRAAGVKAHHRWLADLGVQGGPRFVLVGEAGPCFDMQATVAELHWLKKHGFSSVGLPGLTLDPDLPPLASDYFEPFWSACEDLGLALYMHAGWGEHQGMVLELFDDFASGRIDMEKDIMGIMDGSDPRSPFKIKLTPRRPIWQMMLGGVFDRHPKLKLGLIEVRSDWVPGTLAYLDKRFAKEGRHLKLKPSEYWRRNCFVTPSSPRRVEIDQRNEIGVETLLFGTDFPHPESTWPNTREWMQAALEGVSEADARKMLGENAIRIYGLDAAKLDAIAARIGPTPADLLGVPVDRRLLEAFDRRNGYLSPAENVNTGMIEELLAKDFQAAAAN